MGLFDRILGTGNNNKTTKDPESESYEKAVKDFDSGSYEKRRDAVDFFVKKKKADSKVVDKLMELAKKDNDDLVRRFSMWALGKSQDSRALPLLMDFAQNHPDYGTRCLAVVGLGEMGDPSAKDVLNKCLTSPDSTLRRNAEDALKQIKSK